MNTTRITLNPADTFATINPNIYGHFAEHLSRCIYDGIWVGEDSLIPNVDGFHTDIIEALRQLEPPVIRWPGGCFADDYHWQDGVGPRDQRPSEHPQRQIMGKIISHPVLGGLHHDYRRRTPGGPPLPRGA